jgi:hypothetical protein
VSVLAVPTPGLAYTMEEIVATYAEYGYQVVDIQESRRNTYVVIAIAGGVVVQFRVDIDTGELAGPMRVGAVAAETEPTRIATETNPVREGEREDEEVETDTETVRVVDADPEPDPVDTDPVGGDAIAVVEPDFDPVRTDPVDTTLVNRGGSSPSGRGSG